MVTRRNDTSLRAMYGGIFAGRSVFVTGHTGFKGSWLTIWLHQLGARVHGYSLAAPTTPSNFDASGVRELLDSHVEADVRSTRMLRTALDNAVPDAVFHLAAQPLVRDSYQTPYETFDVNVMGTCNLLEAIRLRGKPCVVVIVTSDKCYENNESHRAYQEDDAMGGHDPYSASKGAAELLVNSYRRSFFPPKRVREHGVKLASARAGNVIGGGDWARDRIVPDIVQHLRAGRPVPVRNPRAVRPWQHILEPLNGYLMLASRMLSRDDAELCSGWNFGPGEERTASVSQLVEGFCSAWEGGSWKNMGHPNQPHEAELLRLSIEKAMTRLNWRPVWDFEQTIAHTVQWYREFYRAAGASMLGTCLDDIAAFALDLARITCGQRQLTPIAA
jgi:CDP-glucose 4,6-dehydratase